MVHSDQRKSAWGATQKSVQTEAARKHHREGNRLAKIGRRYDAALYRWGNFPPFLTERAHMSNIEDLKSTGLKATLPRLKILEVFQNAKQRHMTAEDVYRVLLEDRSDVGLATVYRVLMQFEQAGLLSRSNFESGKAVFELDEGEHHDHLVCLDCGRVEEFFDAEIEKRQQMVAKARGFALQEHALSLYANCIKTDCPHRAAAATQR